MSDLRTVVHRTMIMGGIDLRRARVTARRLPGYLRDYRAFRRADTAGIGLGVAFPITADRNAPAGEGTSHYFRQDLWAARKIHAAAPVRHLDIGSRIDGFIGHLLVFRSVEVIDIRPLPSPVDGLSFRQADATTLVSLDDHSVESLSSLHAVEHFGLGRYGDPLDPDACFTAMAALARVLAPGGRLYFSVPVGRERVEFNAHRILDPLRVIQIFTDSGLDLAEFSALDDDDVFLTDADPLDLRDADEATGLFEFHRPTS